MKKNKEQNQEIKLKKEHSIDNPGQVGIPPDGGATRSLIDSIEKSAETTNKLTRTIKTLNLILVILGSAAVIIGIISLIFQIISK